MELKELIAGYAAFVSTAALGWNIVNVIRDRGKIRVSGFLGEQIIMGLDSEHEPILYYEFVNIGSKPVLITNFGGDFKKMTDKGASHFVVPLHKTSIKLEPGDRHQEALTIFDSIDKNVKFIAAYDSLGRKHKMKNKLLKEMLQQKKKMLSEESISE